MPGTWLEIPSVYAGTTRYNLNGFRKFHASQIFPPRNKPAFAAATSLGLANTSSIISSTAAATAN
jgi:hypothetical protein